MKKSLLAAVAAVALLLSGCSSSGDSAGSADGFGALKLLLFQVVLTLTSNHGKMAEQQL